MKRLMILSTLTLLIVSLGACSQTEKSTVDEPLAENEEVFTWWGDRSQVFSDNEYTVNDEAKAISDLENNFDLQLLPSFSVFRSLIKEDFLIDDVVLEPEEFSIYSSGSELNFASLIKFKDQQGQYLSYGTVAVQYKYIEKIKKVKLYSQRMEIYNATADNLYHGKDLLKTLTSIGEALGLENLEQLIETFSESTADVDALAAKDIVIYEDYQKGKQNRLFGKSFGVTYNENGILEKIYVVTYDYRV